uniref:Secreted protein n=1 Tax=Caenorhabditis tropicalis TaxID=1561998 RepID=A0A1I7UFK6_9PELO
MKFLILSCLTLSAVLAQQTSAPGGNICNYTPVGDESNQKAVPIDTFRTSGLDFVRPNWCITHCADRKSVKVAARFNFANQSTSVATYKVRHTHTRASGLKMNAELISGVPTKRDDDPFNFCIDDAVSGQIDTIVKTYDDIETMSEALNYYINKPGWAYMIYDMGFPPSIIETDNVKQDLNYCSKTVNKQNSDGTFGLFQVFAGLIKSDSS